ncbi:SusF/SusE family outer membrane protein [Labilibaculum sp. 44]|uniref:SusF/SusE family outer membrane protein n=2 Tax=Labilibaculum euxinus TaxID=2686357 RepID=A0A7M4DA19_9BACT|nr:SusF/SusE family outer membrane protein [Labilibaculum euxinus]MVB08703.1 SusF/SusE family outer membrane protein [Labilibaculum euxinus]
MKSLRILTLSKMMVINHLNPKKMKKYYILLFALVGVLGFFTSCDEDGEQLRLSDNVTVPTLTLPDLTLVRANGTDKLIFACTPVDPGFTASATYFLEACPAGNNFETVTQIYSGVTCNNIELTVNQLNSILLNGFPEDATSSVDFRIRCVLEADAGLGVDDLVYYSETVNGDATIFGLLRLDVLISGSEAQKIKSPGSDGIYEGFVKFEAGDNFTLLDPDNNITYGTGTSGIAIDGTAITVADAGWYDITINTNNLTYTIEAYNIGLVGDATPNGWNTPDSKMDYNSVDRTWDITINLTNGNFKFRLNDGWAWNLGGNGTADGSADNYNADNKTVLLSQGGKNIPVPDGAGNYTIKLNITGSVATIIKN